MFTSSPAAMLGEKSLRKLPGLRVDLPGSVVAPLVNYPGVTSLNLAAGRWPEAERTGKEEPMVGTRGSDGTSRVWDGGSSVIERTRQRTIFVQWPQCQSI